ncbi:MAG: carboxypeptidase M32 [Alphaproteobacteria bacterium]|nr:carboxypeptidase M32 [Alphaproteobacteria bacterium]
MSMHGNLSYQELMRRYRRIGILGEVSSMLHWDGAVMMPEASAAARAEQHAELAILKRELLVDSRMGALIEGAWDEDLDDAQQRDVALLERQRLRMMAIPSDLLTALTRQKSKTEIEWRAARAAKDYKAVAPALARLLALVKEQAAALSDSLGLDPYDALLDGFDPEMTAERVDALFLDLSTWLPELIQAAIDRQSTDPAPPPFDGSFAAATQHRLGEQAMAALGFPFDKGRLDLSTHPFTGGIPQDIRMTTRWDEADPVSGLLAVLHETGHALYEAGLPASRIHRPSGRSVGMTLHESQSLFIEMQMARSPAGAVWLSGLMTEHFGPQPAFEPEALGRRLRRVERGFIRVEADEVTYPAHVMLRYRLERGLLADDLSVHDLPEAWAAGMEDLLGVTPPDDALGCLQDIHWYDGAIGYFPTYTLGAMAAAQLAETARMEMADLDARVAAGEVEAAVAWMREKVHAEGSLHGTDDLLTRVTGRPLETGAFRRHLEGRYLDG